MVNTKLGKSRTSNHKKKAWKNIDLTEINQYLEDKELDERTGRTGKDVFYINKEGDANNLKKNKLNDNLSKSDIKQINDQSIETAKQFKHLGSTSSVPAFKSNKRVIQTPLESIRQSKRLQTISKSIELNQSINKQKKEKEEANNKNNRYDLWTEKEKTPIGDVYVDYAEDFEKVRLSRIFKCPRKQNYNILKKPSLLPAVEQPHPGLSYNPNKDEHKDLLISIGDRKKKELKEKRKLNKRVNQGYDPTINVHLENAKEMASGLFSDDDNNESENDSDHNDNDDDDNVCEQKGNDKKKVDEESKNVIISDLKRRKSKKAKRNELRERIDALNAKRRKEKKRLENEFTKLKHYVKEAKTAEQLTAERIEQKKQDKIDRMYRPARRLGKRKYQDPEPEFCLEDELNGSLRKINTDGNLLMDRFKSLQRRNIIEHRHVQLKKRSRPARKRVIRSSVANFNNSAFDDLNDDELK